MNNVIVMGRLTREIELRYTQAGLAIVNASIAVDRKMSKEKKMAAEASGQPTADFPNIVLFGQAAEFLANYGRKGGRILVRGRIQTGRYQNQEGQMIYTTDIVGDEVEIIDWKEQQQGGIDGFAEVNNDDIPF